MPDAVANPLTLVLKIKSKQDFVELKALIEGFQNMPPEENPIKSAMNNLSVVHFARFVFLSETQLAIITTYDNSFDEYVELFAKHIGPIFDQLFLHIVDAPPSPVSKNIAEFLEFIRIHDLKCVPPFYSAYPTLKVLDILTLQKQQAEP